jgi:hypothetical protein
MTDPREHHDDELGPELRDALRTLPREREPGRLLEERTVRALRARGLVEERRRGPGIPRGWLAAAAAAAIALFTGGLALGQALGASRAEETMARMQAESDRRTAAVLRETGSAYVAALAAVRQDGGGPATPQARAEATRVLRAAANEVARIAPDDPVASGILVGLDRAEQQRRRTPGDTVGNQRTVWF